MMKKTLAFGIICLFLITGISVQADFETEIIKTNNGANIKIEKVAYEPTLPKKGEKIIFYVTVSFEECKIPVRVQLYCNGNIVEGDIVYPDELPVLAIIPYQLPDDTSSYKFNVTVDSENIVKEINESDNYWEKTISTDYSGIKRIPLITVLTSDRSDIIVPDDYPTIQGAIDHSIDGDSIKVRPGTYYENIVVNKMLDIISESGAYVTIIHGSGSNHVIRLACDGVKISGFTIRNSGSAKSGIYTESHHHNIIQDNIIENNGDGIELYACNENEIMGNKIVNNQGEGISINSSHMNVITGNRIKNNNNGIHIFFTSTHIDVYDNIISENNNIGVKISQAARSNNIYYNDFKDNDQNAYDSGDQNNIFYNDETGEGNYWDDYTGEDNNGDGIGDTPYNIPDGDSQDLYPMMNPFFVKSDLDCGGSLSWTDIEPGATVTGEFYVENIGGEGTLLNWEIESTPTWGTWTFTPDGGTNLLPGNVLTVEVEVVAPDEPDTEFTGDVKVSNADDPTDYCIISVYLKTPLNNQQNIQQQSSQAFSQQVFLKFNQFLQTITKTTIR